MKISPYLSSKITIFYTLLIVMVVYIHSTYLEMFQYEAADFVWKFWGGYGLCSVANPLFFIISGFLLVGGVTTVLDLLKKLRKRVRTVIVPFILWNAIFVLWYVVLDITPGISRYVNSTGIMEAWKSLPLWESIYNMLTEPAGFHLWFLRDLIVFMAISPLLWLISKRSWIAAIVLSIVLNHWMSWVFWFWLGLTIRVNNWNIEKFPKGNWVLVLTGVIYIGSAVLAGMDMDKMIPSCFGVIGLVKQLACIYFVWIIFDKMAQGRCLSEQGLWRHICGYSFFIYCFHEPAFNIIKKLGVVVLGSSEPMLILLYLINPLIMVAIAIIIAKTMLNIKPLVPVYKFLTGGR